VVSKCGPKVTRKTLFIQIAASYLLLVVGKLLRDGFHKHILQYIIMKALICQTIWERYVIDGSK
jgi:hypothetical protein